MPAYSVQFRPSVEKDLRKLPGPVRSRLLDRIEGLGESPIPASAIKLKDAGGFFRLRVGDYRIVYEVIHTTTTVLVHYIRNRKDVYRAI